MYLSFVIHKLRPGFFLSRIISLISLLICDATFSNNGYISGKSGPRIYEAMNKIYTYY